LYYTYLYIYKHIMHMRILVQCIYIYIYTHYIYIYIDIYILARRGAAAADFGAPVSLITIGTCGHLVSRRLSVSTAGRHLSHPRIVHGRYNILLLFVYSNNMICDQRNGGWQLGPSTHVRPCLFLRRIWYTWIGEGRRRICRGHDSPSDETSCMVLTRQHRQPMVIIF